MKVSVIIPVYNVELYLRECLDSVISQSLDDMEIICVDDGSTDGSSEILREYAEKDGRIVLISQDNKGIGAARNAALDIAVGEYICFVDSDDILISGMLQKLCSLADRNDPDIISFTAKLVYEREELKERHSDFCYHREHLSEEALNRELLSGPELFRLCVENGIYLGTVWSYYYKTDFIRKHGLRFVRYLHEDEDWSMRALLMAERAYLSCEPLYVYRQRDGSIVNSPEASLKSAYNDFRIGLSLLDFVYEKDYSEGVFSAINEHIGVLFEMTRKGYYATGEEERNRLLKRMNPIERHLFEAIICSPREMDEKRRETAELNHVIEKQREENKALINEIVAIRDSRTYRAGNKIAGIYRLVKR